ncbi:MAG TPA: alpha/beta hydrolase [Acidobacteriaceae bacterium]|jgi:pimeloyl-ACP methyl ester carboxylesterase|nr:alpha/beta hydrolase [Acidobacteriaceae bacterium]
MLERRSVQAGRLRLSYLEQGTAAAGEPTLVLLHGLMGTASTYIPMLQAMPPQRHVIALDLPGAGGSERGPRMRATLAAVADHVVHALDALGLSAPVLVGHSHGGAVSLYLAALYPERASGLVLVSPAHPYFRHADQLIRFYMSPVGKAFAHTIPWYPAWLQMIGLRRMAGPQSWDRPERLVPYRENLRTSGTITHLLKLLRSWHIDMTELRHLLQAPFRKPTLLIWGDHDRAVPLSTAGDLQRWLLRSELRVLEGVGHRPAEEQPGPCAEAIEVWLATTGPVRSNAGE